MIYKCSDNNFYWSFLIHYKIYLFLICKISIEIIIIITFSAIILKSIIIFYNLTEHGKDEHAYYKLLITIRNIAPLATPPFATSGCAHTSANTDLVWELSEGGNIKNYNNYWSSILTTNHIASAFSLLITTMLTLMLKILLCETKHNKGYSILQNSGSWWLQLQMPLRNCAR